MKKALILVILLLSVFIGEVMIFEERSEPKEKKPFVAVSTFPLYEISTQLLGKDVFVEKLVPFGVEMHTYRPSAKTMAKVINAELFVFNGLGMEPWVKQREANMLDMSQYANTYKSQADDGHGHEHGSDENTDPHYWLDVNNMILIAQTLSTRYLKHFPQYAQSIKANTDRYLLSLKALQKEYEQVLGACKRDEIVVNHNAFGYLGHLYGFHIHSVRGLSPDEQVSAKKMKEIADLVKEEGIKTIFFESFISPKVAESIAHETGADTKSLQPLANVTEQEAEKGYIALMQENLHKLALALECE